MIGRIWHGWTHPDNANEYQRIVSTEVLPDARATMMSGYLAAASVGRVIGAVLGGVVWTLGGLAAVAAVSAAVNALALISFLWGLRNWASHRD